MPKVEIGPVQPTVIPMKSKPLLRRNGSADANAKSQPDQLTKLPLSDAETADLHSAEKIIGDRETSFEAVGQALDLINKQRLYRASHQKFETYCRVRWQTCPAHACRLMWAVKMLARLRADEDLAKMSPRGEVRVPNNEGHARMLLKVPEESQMTVWRKAVELAGNNPVTAQHLKSAMEPYLPAKPKQPTTLRDWVSGELGRLERKVCDGVSPGEIIQDIQAIKSKLVAGSKRQVAASGPTAMTLVGNAGAPVLVATTTSTSTTPSIVNTPGGTSNEVEAVDQDQREAGSEAEAA